MKVLDQNSDSWNHLTRWQYLLFDHATYNRLAYIESPRCYLKSYFSGLIVLSESWQLVVTPC